ncbi:MAG: carbohydrate kinase family protein [Anaerolineales bacterium]
MDILLSGSIAYDYLMRFPGRFRELLVEQSLDKVSLSFLAEDMQRHDGGVSANIAYTMALLGGRPRLFGTVGHDFEDYRERLEAVGVDTSTVIVIDTVFTGSFFANTDLDNNQIAFFYAGAMGLAGEYGIFDVVHSAPDMVVISPNDPRGMARHVDECKAHNIRYIYDPSQQVARLNGDELRHGIEGCYLLACNEYEWEIIQNQTGFTVDSLRDAGITFVHTLGKDGANIYTSDETIHIPAFIPNEITDPTGAGDAFRGGLLSGLSHGFDWAVSGRMGALMGAYALENFGTQAHHPTPAEFVARFRQESKFDDGGQLDVLLR